MLQKLTRQSAVIAAAMTVAAGPFGPAQAQSTAPAQYVVTYGELAPNAEALVNGKYLLSELTRLAKNDGAQYFSVNFEVDRSNLFTLVEVWQNATTYSAFTSASNVQQTLRYLQPLLIAPLDERDGNLVTASSGN